MLNKLFFIFMVCISLNGICDENPNRANSETNSHGEVSKEDAQRHTKRPVDEKPTKLADLKERINEVINSNVYDTTFQNLRDTAETMASCDAVVRKYFLKIKSDFKDTTELSCSKLNAEVITRYYSDGFISGHPATHIQADVKTLCVERPIEETRLLKRHSLCQGIENRMAKVVLEDKEKLSFEELSARYERFGCEKILNLSQAELPAKTKYMNSDELKCPRPK